MFLCVLVFGFLVYVSFLSSPASDAPERTIVVTAGDDAISMARKLGDVGIFPWPFGYRLYGYVDRSVLRPKVGSYRVQAGTSYHDVARRLAVGPERREATIRVIEGWTLTDIQQNLFQQHAIPYSESASWMGKVLDGQSFDPRLREEFSFLKTVPQTRSLEGYLFPDTYRIWADQLPEGLVRKQLREFDERYGTVQVSRALAPLETLDDVVTLASIVEKEVREPEDKKIVAGIFLRRLRIGMALQSDATLHYLTQSGRSRSTSNDLAIDSAYNSYKHRGLPPGPISNPGAHAIDAVLHPQVTSYLYFLTTDAGKVLYARTFEEHIQNRQRAGFDRSR